MSHCGPLFPSLIPKVVDPHWFNVDKPCDDENELSKLEEEHQSWLQKIADKNKDSIPIGKTAAEHFEEDEDEEDDDADDDDDDDDSDTNDDDDELDTDMIDDRDSAEEFEASMNNNDPMSDSPPWH